MEENRIPKKVLYMILETTRLRGRPRNRWWDEVREDERLVGGKGWKERVYRPATSRVHYTTSCKSQSSAPEDGYNNCPKHVELTGIINKPLLLHLVGCLYYLYQWCMVMKISYNEIYLLIKYIKKRSLESSEMPVLYRGSMVLKG